MSEPWRDWQFGLDADVTESGTLSFVPSVPFIVEKMVLTDDEKNWHRRLRSWLARRLFRGGAIGWTLRPLLALVPAVKMPSDVTTISRIRIERRGGAQEEVVLDAPISAYGPKTVGNGFRHRLSQGDVFHIDLRAKRPAHVYACLFGKGYVP